MIIRNDEVTAKCIQKDLCGFEILIPFALLKLVEFVKSLIAFAFGVANNASCLFISITSLSTHSLFNHYAK